ncbi:MAG: AlkZ family DNA glycosylase [Fibrella sp.]|nr:AlkZ family DNA glycosylase [Armatimonadota bacterium]
MLTLKERNRATLARQLLLSRSPLTPRDAMGQIVGLQAQVAAPPFIGLWTRLDGFARAEFEKVLVSRAVVRAPFFRSTLHFVTADDFCRFRLAIEPALRRALSAFFGERARGLPETTLTEAARALLAEKSYTFAALAAALKPHAPDADPDAVAYLVRTRLPLVQVPNGGAWGYGNSAEYALGEAFTGRTLAPVAEGLPELVRHYLRAFGPATVRDIQTFSGLTGLQSTVHALRPELRVFANENGAELFDMPDAPLPPGDAPAPIRFLPEYDNLLLAHNDRTRIIADEHRRLVFLSAARVRATFLVDGFVGGAWTIERMNKTVTLVIEPFTPLADPDREALAEEGERLLRFVEPGAVTFAVRFT